MARKKVAVIGLGFVGKGMMRLFAASPEFEVVGWDKTMPVDRSVVQGADLAVICVSTPMGEDGSCDTSAVEEVAGWIDAPLVVIKSTVPPGTTDRLNLNECYAPDGRVSRVTPRFHFSPEYMGEPVNFVPPWLYPEPQSPHMHPWVTVGGPRAGEVLEYFAAVMATSARFIPCDAINAEFAKLMENAYYATKVAFVTEMREVVEAAGADWHQTRDLWLADPRVDPDHTLARKAAPGFGGKCLPKDLASLISIGLNLGHPVELLRGVLASNAIARGENAPVIPVIIGRQGDPDGLTAAEHWAAYGPGSVPAVSTRTEFTGWGVIAPDERDRAVPYVAGQAEPQPDERTPAEV